MATQNKVALLINGTANDSWESYDIDSDLQTPADAWRVTLGLGAHEYAAIVAPGDEFMVQIDGILVMTGYVDELDYEVSAETRTLEIGGRDKASTLVDCSAPIFTAKDMTLQQIIDSVVKPLGYSKVKVNAKAALTKKIQVNPGDTAWQVLEQAAEACGCAVWFTPDGTLVVDEPDYTVPVTTTLICNFDGKDNNVLSMKAHYSEQNSFSEVTVLGQSAGSHNAKSKNAIKAVATDPNIRAARKLIIVDGDCETATAAKSRAEKAIADARLDAFTLECEVKGHHAKDSVLWEPGQRIHVLSDVHGVDDVYFLMSRRFLGGNEKSATTILKLKEDGTWITPEKSKKEKSQKKAKKETGKSKGRRGRKKLPLGVVNVTGN